VDRFTSSRARQAAASSAKKHDAALESRFTRAAMCAHETIQWGIVGPGKIARKFARDLRVTGDGRLRAVAGRDLGRARAFADEFGAELAFDDLDALAADPSVDMVYIASPHNAHFETARRLLEAGKPVLCEKPMTVNAAQARELIARSGGRKVFLMEAMWTRFLPLYRRIREWLDDGRIGKPLLVSSAFCIQPPRDPANRFFNPELAGGALLDVGVYNVAISQFVMGRKPDRVSAIGHLGGTGVDELLSASLHYESGGLAQIACGLTTAFDNALVIGGEKGFIRVPATFIHGRKAILHVGGNEETISLSPRGEGFEYEAGEAMRCFRAGAIESPLMPHADTLANLETMDEIRRQIGLCYPCERA
jgi:dihydrodiol dehydrogenase / D-xylose 1-dehydrogenase (NADP)